MIGAGREEFTIVVVDDELDSIDSQMNETREYLETTHGMRLILDQHEETSNILEKINSAADVAIIDKNLDGDDGICVVKKIRQRYPLLDILLYTAKGVNLDEFKEISTYSAVEVVDDRRFEDRLRTLIDKNLSKWSDIIFLRGAVISRIVELEAEINDVLSDYFMSAKEQQFSDLVLENRYIPLEAKKTILSKMVTADMKKFEAANKLTYLQRMRNELAHCRRNTDNPNTLVSMGKPKTFDDTAVKKIFREADDFSAHLASFKLEIAEQDG